MDLRNQTLINPAVAGDINVSFSASETALDRGNVSFGEFGVSILASGKSREAVFPSGIPSVVGPGSQEKVCRVDAGRVVAGMADGEPFGDGTVGEGVGEPVGLVDRPPVAHNPITSYAASSPLQAAVFGLSSSRPEGFWGGGFAHTMNTITMRGVL